MHNFNKAGPQEKIKIKTKHLVSLTGKRLDRIPRKVIRWAFRQRDVPKFVQILIKGNGRVLALRRPELIGQVFSE